MGKATQQFTQVGASQLAAQVGPADRHGKTCLGGSCPSHAAPPCNCPALPRCSEPVAVHMHMHVPVRAHLCPPPALRCIAAALQVPLPRGAWDDSSGFVSLTKYATGEARAQLEAGMLQAMPSGYLAYAAAGALLRYGMQDMGFDGCCLLGTGHCAPGAAEFEWWADNGA